ncbi:MAG: DUF5371 family protein [Archaeoglobaceae archaeon]
MVKIVHAQTLLSEELLNELKKKTGEKATKDAITTAVEHYLTCQHVHEDQSMNKRLEEIMMRKHK